MLKVLLVDDEAIIKQGLREQIDWETVGFVVSGEASDGAEAMNLIRHDPPDLVISDIQMPFKAGLDLMEEARTEYPRIQFLFISGHDEFRYVQRALKLGAGDYILKPIDPDYLSQRLIEMAAQMETEDRHEAALVLSKRAEIRRFLQDTVIRRRADESVLVSEANDTGINAAEAHYRVVSLQIDRYYQRAVEDDDETMASIHRDFFEIARKLPADHGFQLTENIREYDICFLSDSREGVEKLTADLLAHLTENRKERIFTVSLGMSEITGHLSRLADCFAQAREALELKFLHGDDAVYTWDMVRRLRLKDVTQDVEGDFLERLAPALRNGSEEETIRAVRSISDSLGASPDPQRSLTWAASASLLAAAGILKELGYAMEEVIDNPLKEWGDIDRLQTAESAVARLEGLLVTVARYVAKRKDMRSSQILDQALGYIREHFAENAMSLDSAADVACMSPCYFSVLFKQETGENFQRYLTNLRIAKAKDLILYTDQKSYEIAPQVGYENASYFSTVFKKATGMSPSEYRKQFS